MDQLLDALNVTIRMATEYAEACNLPGDEDESVIDFSDIDDQSPEHQMCEQKERALREYLDTLDFELVKDIQSIMYLGRDADYDQKESFQQRFITQRKHMDRLGWKDKWIEINQMVEKLPLAQYLKNGMRILGM